MNPGIVTARNFDLFRITHSQKQVDVSPEKPREWSRRENGPRIYRMNDDEMVWMRFSEVEAFILANSKIMDSK